MKTERDFSENVRIPEGLEQELSDMIDSMDAAEKILPPDHSPARYIAWMTGIAAGIVMVAGLWTAVLDYRTPKDSFTDPEMAYAEVEKALATISEKMNPGLEKAAAAEKTIERNLTAIKKLYED